MSSNFRNFGMLLLRVVLGIVFILHGFDKLQNLEGVVDFFSSLGLAPFFAYLVAYTEFLGGIALLLGVFSRYAAYALSTIMVVAIFLVKMKAGFLGGYELDLVLLVSLLATAWSGSGKYSLSGKMCECGDCAFCGMRLFRRKKMEGNTL